MFRPRPLALCLLALLLLGQAAVAASHCLRMAGQAAPGQAIAVPICTPEGLQLRPGATPGPGKPIPHLEAALCFLCHGLPEAVLPEPPLLPAMAWSLASSASPLLRHDNRTRVPPRAPPYVPRGPPLG